VKELQFKPKFTPEQVKEKIAKATKAAAPEKTLPLPNAEKAAKPKPEKKETKAKTEKKEAPVEFPVSGHVNAYGFLFLKVRWLKTLDWHLDMSVKIERNADGSITVRKA
jgi:hypothetical protein